MGRFSPGPGGPVVRPSRVDGEPHECPGNPCSGRGERSLPLRGGTGLGFSGGVWSWFRPGRLAPLRLCGRTDRQNSLSQNSTRNKVNPSSALNPISPGARAIPGPRYVNDKLLRGGLVSVVTTDTNPPRLHHSAVDLERSRDATEPGTGPHFPFF